jgi:hypothetical protein
MLAHLVHCLLPLVLPARALPATFPLLLALAPCPLLERECPFVPAMPLLLDLKAVSYLWLAVLDPPEDLWRFLLVSTASVPEVLWDCLELMGRCLWLVEVSVHLLLVISRWLLPSPRSLEAVLTSAQDVVPTVAMLALLGATLLVVPVAPSRWAAALACLEVRSLCPAVPVSLLTEVDLFLRQVIAVVLLAVPLPFDQDRLHLLQAATCLWLRAAARLVVATCHLLQGPRWLVQEVPFLWRAVPATTTTVDLCLSHLPHLNPLEA